MKKEVEGMNKTEDRVTQGDGAGVQARCRLLREITIGIKKEYCQEPNKTTPLSFVHL